MGEYWKSYWKDHLHHPHDSPFQEVGRTLNRQPMDEATFQRYAEHLLGALELDPQHRILDFCCGNGLLSAPLAHQCCRVIGVDFSPRLIHGLRSRTPNNVVGLVGDGLEIQFREESFDRILFAAAIQHFGQAQVIRLFEKLISWLRPGGLLLVSDICDSEQIWEFFNNPERESIYFSNVSRETPVLGTWFNRLWLEKLAAFVGFRQARALDQPADYWYSHYRFDLLCRK